MLNDVETVSEALEYASQKLWNFCDDEEGSEQMDRAIVAFSALVADNKRMREALIRLSSGEDLVGDAGNVKTIAMKLALAASEPKEDKP